MPACIGWRTPRRCPVVAKGEILLVDDEEGVRHSWERFLVEEGHSVKTASDGNMAIAYLSGHPVDLVIADLRMPGPDGLEVLQWIRESPRPTRFILLTGYGTKEVERRAMALGAFDYLQKPVAPQVLASMVAAALQEPLPPAVMDAKAKVSPVVPAEERQALPRPTPDRAPEKPGKRSWIANLAALAFAPLLGLAFVVFLPVIGFALFGYLLVSRLRKTVGPAGEPGTK